MERRGFLRMLGLAAAGVAAMGFIPQPVEPVKKLKCQWTMGEPQYREHIDAEAELTAMLSAYIAADIDRNILHEVGWRESFA